MEAAKTLYPIVDEHGQPTGRTITSLDARAEGVRLGYVHVYVFNKKGEILIQQRTPRARARPNLLDPSAAGHIEPNETPLQSALTELREELGIEVASTQIKPLFVDIAPKWWTQVYTLTHEGPFVFPDNEVAGLNWHDLNDVKIVMEKFPYLMSDGFVSSLKLFFAMERGA